MTTIKLNFEDFKENQLNRQQTSTIKGGKLSAVPSDPPAAPAPTPPSPLPSNGYPADPEVPQQPIPGSPLDPSPYTGIEP
ncbi:MAG: hypothetical protein ABI426_01810 [Flavobacterium sp.]